MEKCYHCKDIISSSQNYQFDGKKFCCSGCESVYKILFNSSAQEYYEHKHDLPGLKPKEETKDFKYLDHQEFIDEYYQKSEETYYFTFYIEGVHCTACLWLLEKLSAFNKEIISSKLNMTDSTLNIEFTKKTQLSEIAKLIQSFGYTPHAILDTDDQKNYEKKEDKKSLMRIGIAFACAGNIMLYSFAIYLGAQGEFIKYFNLFSFICTIPVVFYCAIPFYKSALSSFSAKVISIDLPIVIVILSAFILGGLSLIVDWDYFYFDTISILIFLLLFSRYLLKAINRKALSMESISSFYLNQVARKITSEGEEVVLSKYLEIGDEVLVKSQEIVPADGLIIKGSSYLNNSVITGESLPVAVSPESMAYMGAINNSNELHIRVKQKTINSRMGTILSDIEKGWSQKNSIMTFVDTITRYFSIILLVLSFSFFAYFYFFENIQTALDRTFSLLLITCPCALALSTPLAMILGLGAMLKKGIFVKDERVLERLSQVRNIYLDKTGTLTDGEFKVNLDSIDYKYLNIIYSLERNSSHPIAKSICQEIEKKYNPDFKIIKNFIEIPGVGVSGIIDSIEYRFVASVHSNSAKNTIDLFENNQLITQVEVEDNLRAGAMNVVNYLQSRGVKVHILSGDKEQRVKALAGELGINHEDCFWEVSPEEKTTIVKNSDKAIMLGDGMNDSSAIQQAFVGIAVSSSTQSSLKASDIYLSRSGVESIVSLFQSSDEIDNIIRRNLLFSLFYNMIGVYLAWNGLVSPVLAAIFMPISSLTVLLSTINSTKRINFLIS